MTEANIGPIKIPMAHLQDKNNIFKSEKEIKEIGNVLIPGKIVESEEFSVVLENYLVKQLQGLNRWNEIFWIDTSPELVDNEDPTHRGWYLLSFKEPSFGVKYAELSVEAKCISKNEMELFEMDYTVINELPYDYPNFVNLAVEESYYSTLLDTDGKIKIDTTEKSSVKYPTSMDDWDHGDGTGPFGWINQGDITEDNVNNYAYSNSSGPGWTFWLRGKDFNHNIPSNAQITNLRMDAKHKTTGSYHGIDYKLYISGEDRIWRYSNNGDWRYYDGSNWIYFEIWASQFGYDVNSLTPARVNGMWAAFASSMYTNGCRSHCDFIRTVVWWRYKSGTYQRFQPIDNSKTNWGQIELTQTIPSGCSITWDVLNASDNSPLLTNQTGDKIDISSLSHVNLRLVATLTANGATSPTIDKIRVTETGDV